MKNAAGYAPRSGAQTLADDVAFSLYSTSLAMTKRYKPLLDPLGLTYPQYLAMLTLWANDEVTVKSLAARLSLDPATVTSMLKRLESQGYITRVRGTSDERLVFIRLTDKGRALYRSAASIPAAALRGGFNGSMQHNERRTSGGSVANETEAPDLLQRKPEGPDVGTLA